MFEIYVGSAICSIVEAMLPVGSERSLFIMVDLHMEHPDRKVREGNSSRSVSHLASYEDCRAA